MNRPQANKESVMTAPFVALQAVFVGSLTEQVHEITVITNANRDCGESSLDSVRKEIVGVK